MTFMPTVRLFNRRTDLTALTPRRPRPTRLFVAQPVRRWSWSVANSHGTVLATDAESLLANMRPGSAGMVFIDPPGRFGESTRQPDVGDDDMPDFDYADLDSPPSLLDLRLDALDPIARATATALKPGGSVVVIGDMLTHAAWQWCAADAGLVPMGHMVVEWEDAHRRGRRGRWSHSTSSYDALRPGFTIVGWYIRPGFRSSYSIAMSTTAARCGDVLSCCRVPDEEKYVGQQLPVELYLYLMDRLGVEGDTVVDPMCGSGSSLVAAELMERRWVACDSDVGMVAVARKRVDDVTREEAWMRPMRERVAGKWRVV